MSKTVFVPAGTGKQGSVVTKALLDRGYTVHVTTRNPSSSSAKELQSKGAVLHEGGLDSAKTLEAAAEQADALFLAIRADPTDEDLEIRYAKSIIEAARKKGVKTIVYTSVARTGEHESFPGWGDDFPLAWYWKNKHIIEELVRTAGFENWTIFRPAFFNNNFVVPDVDFMFPDLARKHLLQLPFNRDTTLDLVSVEDIARFVVAAIESPSTFAGKELGLASEKLTAEQIAEQLSTISGHKVKVEYISDDQVKLAKEQGNIVLDSYLWHRDVGYNVDIEALKQYKLPLTPMSKDLNKDNLGW
ncbi:NmrA family protein [Pyrenochaeta sp. MPI-SDFR-AT-0127]|nr:NmrA family protein [Pyrenochaeta sp. MPI-SDFR-AT-0127]